MSKLNIISRLCAYSNVSAHKNRPPWFNRVNCFTKVRSEAYKHNHYVVYDEAYGSVESSFLYVGLNSPVKDVVKINCGTEASAFLKTLDFMESLGLEDDDIVYIVEDDYLHRRGWSDILQEGIEVADSLGGAYVTLYDHADKYRDYEGLKNEILISESSHWRTTPSTTNTHAFRYSTYKKTAHVHRQFSERVNITEDHQKFLALRLEGQKVISSIPGWSTHVETGLLSPCIDWKYD